MPLNERMLPFGKTKTVRTGDWLYTLEVVNALDTISTTRLLPSSNGGGSHKYMRRKWKRLYISLCPHSTSRC